MQMTEEVPDVLSTGLSKEYVKAYGRLNLWLRSIYEGRTTVRIKEFAKKNLLNYTFKTYQQWFREDRFVNVVNDVNRDAIRRLDEIVNELNSLVKSGDIISLPKDDAPHKPTELFNEAMSLIMGNKNFNFKKICEMGEVTGYFST